jgi:hypothetical protein
MNEKLIGFLIVIIGCVISFFIISANEPKLYPDQEFVMLHQTIVYPELSLFVYPKDIIEKPEKSTLTPKKNLLKLKADIGAGRNCMVPEYKYSGNIVRDYKKDFKRLMMHD